MYLVGEAMQLQLAAFTELCSDVIIVHVLCWQSSGDVALAFTGSRRELQCSYVIA